MNYTRQPTTAKRKDLMVSLSNDLDRVESLKYLSESNLRLFKKKIDCRHCLVICSTIAFRILRKPLDPKRIFIN